MSGRGVVPGLTLCRAGRADLDWMIARAEAEGWNPGLEDGDAFYNADPGGFFLARHQDRIVACISVVNHSDSFAFLGFYICDPAFRGQGIGLALWRHALDHAGARTVGLDGVAAQEGNYARAGFVRSGATLRMEGPAPLAAPTGTGAGTGAGTGMVLRPATPADGSAIARMDAAATGVTRAAFLSGWTATCRTRRSFVLLDGAGAVAGMATARLCRAGCKIGPVIAADRDQAVALIAHAARQMGQDRITLDIPDGQGAFVQWAQRAGFVQGFATARMYRGPAPVPVAGGPTAFAIATMELG